jgi:protein-S-isoprenylcysteine O-methyltransferase Ste14
MPVKHLILVLWLIGAVYWIVAAPSAKTVRRREPLATRLPFLVQMVITAVLLWPHTWPGWLDMKVVGGGWYRFWIAVALVALGLALAIWARRALGDNWSGTVTVKEGHELVQNGPYRRIRHPIYSGILLMILGTGLAGGHVHGLLAFPIALVALWLRSRMEETWMVAEFGERYESYRKTSRAIIPFIL